jgi:hypothetical protein
MAVWPTSKRARATRLDPPAVACTHRISIAASGVWAGDPEEIGSRPVA